MNQKAYDYVSAGLEQFDHPDDAVAHPDILRQELIDKIDSVLAPHPVNTPVAPRPFQPVTAPPQAPMAPAPQ